MPVLSELKCPGCGATILSDDVDVAKGLARCSICSRMLQLEAGPAPIVPTPSFEPRPVVARPEKFRVSEDLDVKLIEWRWFTPLKLPLLAFAGVWTWISFPNLEKPSLKSFLWASVGLVMMYSGLANLLNRTRLLVSQRSLRVQLGPLPWLGGRTFGAGEIDQLYCIERMSQGKGGASFRYEVRAQLKNGTDVKVVSDLSERIHALFLEYELERMLDIADRPVPGELRR
jgi:hypothetical protein